MSTNTPHAALSRLNFRDVGGLDTADGGRIRSGLLYRSEGPASFLAEHREELAALEFRTVCDLRAAVEREAAPNDWCGPDCHVLALDMNTDLRAQGESGWASLRDDPSGANALRVMGANYRLMPAALLPHLSIIAGALLAGETPMLIHCTAGKDRTGVAIALILLLAGVPQAAILTDYRRSDVFAGNMHVAGSVEDGFRKTFGFVPSAETIAAIIGTNEQFVLGAMEEVRRGWGDVENYFEAGGVDQSRQHMLREVLIERNSNLEGDRA